jgi:hypothetical protein
MRDRSQRCQLPYFRNEFFILVNKKRDISPFYAFALFHIFYWVLIEMGGETYRFRVLNAINMLPLSKFLNLIVFWGSYAV